jgi:hypothetical protein
MVEMLLANSVRFSIVFKPLIAANIAGGSELTLMVEPNQNSMWFCGNWWKNQSEISHEVASGRENVWNVRSL